MGKFEGFRLGSRNTLIGSRECDCSKIIPFSYIVDLPGLVSMYISEALHMRSMHVMQVANGNQIRKKKKKCA